VNEATRSARSSPRVPRQPTRYITGSGCYTLRRNGIGSARRLMMSSKAFPPLREPVKPTSLDGRVRDEVSAGSRRRRCRARPRWQASGRRPRQHLKDRFEWGWSRGPSHPGLPAPAPRRCPRPHRKRKGKLLARDRDRPIGPAVAVDPVAGPSGLCRRGRWWLRGSCRRESRRRRTEADMRHGSVTVELPVAKPGSSARALDGVRRGGCSTASAMASSSSPRPWRPCPLGLHWRPWPASTMVSTW